MALKQLNKKADENFWDGQWNQNSFEKAVTYVNSFKQYQITKEYTDKTLPVLEGGCGLSQWVYAMHHEGYNIIGVDYAKKTVERVKNLVPELDIREGNVFELDFPDGYFGTYCSWGVVEHFEDGPEPILEEAYRVIAKNGYFLVSVPFLNPARKKAYKGLGFIGQGEFYQYMFDELEFKEKLEKVGFKVEDTYKLNWVKSYKEVLKYTKKTKDIINIPTDNINIQKSIEFKGDNIIKKSIKRMIIKLEDNQLITKNYGHMILFVAKKI